MSVDFRSLFPKKLLRDRKVYNYCVWWAQIAYTRLQRLWCWFVAIQKYSRLVYFDFPYSAGAVWPFFLRKPSHKWSRVERAKLLILALKLLLFIFFLKNYVTNSINISAFCIPKTGVRQLFFILFFNNWNLLLALLENGENWVWPF